jgi:hypothetical protein
MSMEELLTTAEAAQVLRMRSDSIIRKIKRGGNPCCESRQALVDSQVGA